MANDMPFDKADEYTSAGDRTPLAEATAKGGIAQEIVEKYCLIQKWNKITKQEKRRSKWIKNGCFAALFGVKMRIVKSVEIVSLFLFKTNKLFYKMHKFEFWIKKQGGQLNLPFFERRDWALERMVKMHKNKSKTSNRSLSQ